MGRKTAQLIMMRHGQSEWNKLNLFTGWVDIPLSRQGIQESFEGGKKIADIPIDVIFVSSLIRAQMTAMLALVEHKSGRVPFIQHSGEGKLESWATIYGETAKKNCIPVITAWELNERMYGRLQGMNKQETRDKFGDEQVHIWRRSFDQAPPEGESLKMTAERSIPYFQQKIVPHLEKGENVFISAHGNSLRSIVMHIENMSEKEVIGLEIATGDPLIYNYEDGAWKKHGH